MEIDEFFDKVENGETFAKERPKTEVDVFVEELNTKQVDKVIFADKIVNELKNQANKLAEQWTLAESKISKIKELLLLIRTKLAADDILSARNILAEIYALHELISDDFLDEKNKVKADIAFVESQLLVKANEFEKKDVERKSRIIVVSTAEGKKYALAKRVDFAINEYKRCQEIYKSFPEGFSREKVEMYRRIVELYKEILIAAQISHLQNKLNL